LVALRPLHFELPEERCDEPHHFAGTPAFVSGIKLGNLRVYRLNVRMADQPCENVSKNLHAWMRGKITADSPWVIVAVEKLCNWDDLPMEIRPQPSLQRIACADGSGRFIANSISIQTWQAPGTRGGNETVGPLD
jgi:hypothetical protein